METIKIEDWAKVEARIGEIKSAEKIVEADRLLLLKVSFGITKIKSIVGGVEVEEEKEELRQIVSGIATFFPEPSVLVGKRCAFVTNLEPRMLKGFESQGMILAAKSGDSLSLLEVDQVIVPGTRIS